MWCKKIGFLLLNNVFIFVLGQFYLSMTQVLVDLSVEALVWFLVYFEMLPAAVGRGRRGREVAFILSHFRILCMIS